MLLTLHHSSIASLSRFMLCSKFPALLAVVDDWEDTTMFSFLDSRDKTAVVAKRMKYFTNSGKKVTFYCYPYILLR